MAEHRKSIQKLISIPKPMYEVLEKKAQKRGLLIPEYIRHVLLIDLSSDFEKIPLVSEATETRIAKSIKDYKKGKFKTLDLKKNPNAFSDLMKNVKDGELQTTSN